MATTLQPFGAGARLCVHEAVAGRNDCCVRAGRAPRGLHLCGRSPCGADDSAGATDDADRRQDIGVDIGARAPDAGGHPGNCRAVA